MVEITVDIQAADCRFTATMGEGTANCLVKDTSDLPAKQKSMQFECTGKQLGMLVALLVSPDGESFSTDECYAELEPVIGHLPQNLRPIP